MDSERGARLPAITLWQPWASLIAVKAKSYETRGWAPPAKLIGKRIAIHAARKAPPWDIDGVIVEAMEEHIGPRGTWGKLPFGAVVCTATLRGAYQVQRSDIVFGEATFRRNAIPGSPDVAGISFAGDEMLFGDWRQSRWVWELTDVEPLTPPVLARGAQGIWTWTPGEEPEGCHAAEAP